MELIFKENPNKNYYCLDCYYNNFHIGEISRGIELFWLKLNIIEPICLSSNINEAKIKAEKTVSNLEKFFNKYFK